jgi:hypothetical protein
MPPLLSTLDTCDIVMFGGVGCFSSILQCVVSNKYIHTGMIIKNPGKYIKSKEELKDGLYILESTRPEMVDATDNHYKFGVQLHHLDEILQLNTQGTVFVRHIECVRDDAFYTKFGNIYKEVHNKPYDIDIIDWITGRLNINFTIPVEPEFKRTDTFWCSALVAYILCELGLIDSNVNWSIIAPGDYGSDEPSHISFKCNIGNDTILY